MNSGNVLTTTTNGTVWQQPYILPSTNGNNTWAYMAPTTDTNRITIDQAENGFIIWKNNEKYVAKNMVDVVELLSTLTKKEEK